MDTPNLRRTVIEGVHAVRSWATWSPGRFRAVVLGAAAVVVGVPVAVHALTPAGPAPVTVAVAGPAGNGPASSTSTGGAAAPGPLDVAPSTGATSPADEDDLRESTRVRSEVGAAVAGFVGALLSGRAVPAGADGDRAWAEQVAPYVTADVAGQLAQTNRDRLPDARLVKTSIGDAYGDTVTARATLTDGTALDVTTQWDGQRWLVAAYEPVTATAPAPTTPASSATPSGSPTAVEPEAP